MPTKLITVLCCAALALGACSSDDDAPIAGGGGGSPVGGEDDAGAPARDAAAADEDSGIDPALARECDRVNPGDYGNEDIPFEERPSGASLPADFVVTREVATWTGDCEDPELLIKLSGGHCADGDGHELDIWISANATEDGTLVVGENVLLPEPDQRGVRVRYTRPKSLADTDLVGTWGGCAAASGQVVFPDVPDVSRTGQFRGRFLFTLTACEGGELAPIDVVGSFNVELERDRDDYCPPK